jgi:hypothetical protein
VNGTRVESRRQRLVDLVLFILVLGATGAWTLLTLTPPPDVARDGGFESDLAMAHLAFIARAPRPLGSGHHEEVRQHLVNELRSLGLLVEVQEARVPLRRDGTGPRIEVANVVARLPGTGGGTGKAVMLAAHYDSTHTNSAASRGAGDDGAAVAALLEAARVLTSDRPQNDVIFLITDGEERALLGARAFVEEHPWLAHAGVVFNFEARGTSGPSLMFQTSGGNGWLVDQYARVAPCPRTSSIGYEIYRLMPNDTDFTIFRNAGLPGLNFAFIGDYHNYHRAGDNIDNLDVRSLRHHGVQALALARHFGNLNLDLLPTTGEAVYFNVGNYVVRYPQRWSLPLALAAAAACLFTAFRGWRRGDGGLHGILWFIAIFLLDLTVCVALAWVVVRFVPIAWLDRNANRAIAAFTLLALTTTALLVMVFRRRANLGGLATGSMIVWGALSVISAVLIPAASYLLIVPALFGAVALLSTRVARGILVRNALAIVTALPLVLVMTPVVYLAFLGLRMRLAPATVALVVLAVSGLLPQLALLTSRYAGGARSPRSAVPDRPSTPPG